MDGKINNLRNTIILCSILLAGFALRSYNLNSPPIGYHNMKENEYLSMAQEMIRTNDYTKRRIYFYRAFEKEPTMKIYPQPPLVSYQTLIVWKLLGENIWGARLLNVFFGVASILVIYFVGLILFKDNVLSLFCAFLLAIMPLAVFFSRNLQPESPAFFFMLLGNLFYLKYAASLKKRNLILGGIALSVSWLYKFSFLIGLFPFAFCFPLKTLFREKKGLFKFFLAFILPYSIIILAIIWLKYIGQWEFEELQRIKLWEIFTFSYWEKYGRAIWWYTKGENFTIVYIVLTLSGIAITSFRRKQLINRYILGWTFAIVPYSMVFSDYINQHNYYQMPFLILICVSSVYAISHIPEIITVKNIVKKYFLLFVIIAAGGISLPSVHSSISRMYGTVFLGLDVAGDSLRELTNQDERIFLLTHAQGQGIARYARRYTGWTDDLEDFKGKEKRFNIKYICFYPAEFALALKAKNPPLFNHIQNSYHVKEVGLVEEPNNIFYIILEKGEGSDPNTFLQSFGGIRQLRTIYRVLNKYVFFYSLRQQK